MRLFVTEERFILLINEDITRAAVTVTGEAEPKLHNCVSVTSVSRLQQTVDGRGWHRGGGVR